MTPEILTNSAEEDEFSQKLESLIEDENYQTARRRFNEAVDNLVNTYCPPSIPTSIEVIEKNSNPTIQQLARLDALDFAHSLQALNEAIICHFVEENDDFLTARRGIELEWEEALFRADHGNWNDLSLSILALSDSQAINKNQEEAIALNTLAKIIL